MGDLLRKLLNIKRDYVEIIPENKITNYKVEINKFLNEVRLNKGKVKSVQAISLSETKSDFHSEFNAGLKKADSYSTGYEDKVEYYTETSSHFIIHYRCHKELEYKRESPKDFHFGLIE
jgi:hypothetical protein